MVPECCVCHASFDVVCDVSEYGMFVCVSLSVNVCMFTVSNALLMFNVIVMVRVGGMGWLKPVATVLLMLCSVVFVECLVLNPCCVVIFGMFCVRYGRITFSSVFAITDRRDIGLYDVDVFVRFVDRYDVGQFPYIIIIIYSICIALYNALLYSAVVNITG